MKQKILEALKQGHKNLGLSDEAFERVATFGETFITSEEQIPNFVKGAEAILKSEQSAADKERTKSAQEKKVLEDKIADLEAKLNKGVEPPQEGNNEPPEPKPQGDDFFKKMEALFEAKMKPLQDKLNAFESDKATKLALNDGESKFRSNDWVKKYPDEANDAWERAIELNQATGSKKSGDELAAMALGYFGKAVSRKGDDITKPFKSEGGGEAEPNFDAFDRVVAKREAESNPKKD